MDQWSTKTETKDTGASTKYSKFETSFSTRFCYSFGCKMFSKDTLDR